MGDKGNDELDLELWNLAKEIRGHQPPAGLVAAIIGLLENRREKPPALPKVAPAFLTTLLLLLSFSFFFFISHPTLNTAKIFLAVFSSSMGLFFIFYPGRMAFLAQKLLGNLLVNKGPVITPRQEMILFRLQGLFFILLAVLIYRL